MRNPVRRVLAPSGMAGPYYGASMLLKAGGFFFLLSGWAIVLSAVALLGSPATKGGFVAAGLRAGNRRLVDVPAGSPRVARPEPMNAAADFDAFAVVAAFCILLAPLALIGLAIANTGFGRSRSASHAMLSAMCVLGVAALAWLVCGFAWQGYPGLPHHAVRVAGAEWDWLGAGPLFLGGVALDGSHTALAAWFGIFSVGMAALIPLGAGADRWRLGAACISSALLAGWTYPLFAHWVWGGGWLLQLGAQHGLGRGFLDPGGASTIHVVGGLTALAVAWIVGPRRGKFSAEGTAAIPGHNAVLVGASARWWRCRDGSPSMLRAACCLPARGPARCR